MDNSTINGTGFEILLQLLISFIADIIYYISLPTTAELVNLIVQLGKMDE